MLFRFVLKPFTSRLRVVCCALVVCGTVIAEAADPPRSVFEAIASRPWVTEPAAPTVSGAAGASRRKACDYAELVGQAFSEADLSIIETPFRISYTHAPPIAFAKPRVTVLVDLTTDRILRVLCPGPVSSAR